MTGIALALAGDATREVQWNVTTAMLVVMYGSMAAALAVFAVGTWRRVRIWRLGTPDLRWDQPGRRLRRVGTDVLAQGRVLRDRIPGVMHALIFFGFGVLFIATVVVFIDHDLGIPIMRGPFYLLFQSLLVDLFGLLVLVGVGIAAYRRYVIRPARLERGNPADALLLAALFLLAATGFVLEGIRIELTDDPWAGWSPVGLGFGAVLASLVSTSALDAAYPWLWVFHLVLWHALLALIPFTKLFHIVTTPLSAFFATLDDGRGVVPATDFEAERVRLGVSTPLDLGRRQLLFLDACTECGRCQDACPAHAEGKPLSPKRVILDLRDQIREDAGPLLEAKAWRDRGEAERCEAILGEMAPLAGGVIRPETLWACTTCRACEEACPVSIDHVALILELRQNLAMEQAEVPEGVGDLVGSLEAREQPFRGTVADREGWYEGLEVRTLAEVEDPAELDLLYWVGCAATTDDRAREVARALVRVLNHAGVSFAVLGSGERCCGDPARRTGNEYHYDMLARANVDTLDGAGMKRILTHCPHCLQTLRHEYGAFGGDYEVVHHSEYVTSLIAEGRIDPGGSDGATVTFHDPCYLGRYNRTFDAPRSVLDDLELVRAEMPRSREGSFCCGAGGGHGFYDDAEGGRINRNRMREAIATGADTVGTGCPFCLAMLEDAARAESPAGEGPAVRDLAELVADRLDDASSTGSPGRA